MRHERAAIYSNSLYLYPISAYLSLLPIGCLRIRASNPSLDFWTNSIFTLLLPAPLRLLPSINYKVLIYFSLYFTILILTFHLTTSRSLIDLPVPISYILYLPPYYFLSLNPINYGFFLCPVKLIFHNSYQ